MKFRVLKSTLAVILSSSMLMCAIPSVNVSAQTKTVVSSNFNNGNTGWGSFKQSGGSYTLTNQNGKLACTISNVGTLNYSVQFYYSPVKLMKGGVYRLSYEISSTVDREVEAMIQQDGGKYTTYTWKGLKLTPETQTVDYTFTMEDDTDIMAKFCVNCGNEGEELPEHTIYMDNFVLELVDDSNVDYDSEKPYEEPILVNQVGYTSDRAKTAVFRQITDEKEFSVVNADSGQTVYTGQLYGEKNYTAGDETVWYGDFSDVTAEGNYYITCGNLDKSYTFSISDNVYDNITDDLVRMFYLQRCGTEIKDTDFSHPACHTGKAKVYGTNDYIDVTGGWHDAGDYGRYTVAAAKAVADLLYAYGNNPSLFSDSVNIPESGNGVPDILDETRYELEWMLKMQDQTTGGVHHKVTCENFPGYVMPQNETAELIVTPVSSTSTADFCASMALAYQYYKDYDKDFAEKCLNAAEKAWNYLEKNPQFDFKNPSDITTGEYGDSNDTDERYWATAQMYAATGEQKYLDKYNSLYAQKGMDWTTVGDYGSIAILTKKDIDKTSNAYKKAYNSIIKQADNFVSISSDSGYKVATNIFNWGSNMTIANAGTTLGLAYQLTGEQKYLDAANAQTDYLLGINGVSECFVTGYGTKSPKNPHHRPSMALDKPMKGMLVGGVNSNLEDNAAKAYCADSPAAKCYIDNKESYSTNEITIYWNSPFVYLLSLTNSESGSEVTDLKGDVNVDGKVDINDVKLLQDYILNKETITEQGFKNGDMNSDNKVNVSDLAILKEKAGKNSDKPVQTTATTKVTTTTTTTTTTTKAETPSGGNEPASDVSMLADFRKGNSSQYFIASDGWSNGSCFDCYWTKNNTSFENGVLNLKIDKGIQGYNYTGAEYRTNDFYSYGYYETSMKAIKNDGVVSSFFTYTGPSDNNPWDEIDVEVLGKDTTKVQFNYYTNGVGNHEYMYDLGFDASEGFHTYGFDWQPDSITWYVDGKAVYKATSNIPSTPGKIMMNAWPGTGVDDWLKPFDGKTPLTASYEWVTYKK